MAPIVIERLNRYESHGRFRVDYVARDESGAIVRESRLSFDSEPDTAAEDAAFARLQAQLENPPQPEPEPLVLERDEVDGLTEKELAALVRERTGWDVQAVAVGEVIP